jgi:hypothetical protein
MESSFRITERGNMPGEWTVIGGGAVRTKDIASIVITEYDDDTVALEFLSYTGVVLHTLPCESVTDAQLKLAEFVMDDTLREEENKKELGLGDIYTDLYRDTGKTTTTGQKVTWTSQPYNWTVNVAADTDVDSLLNAMQAKYSQVPPPGSAPTS